MEPTESTCRTCLKKKYKYECVNISLEEENNSFILEMISFTIPELDVFLVNNPVICKGCIKRLKESYNFKTECLKNEEYLLNYSQNNNKKINMSEIRLPAIRTTHQMTDSKDRGKKNSKYLKRQGKSKETVNNSLSCENCHGCQSNVSYDPTLHKKVYLPPYICYNCNKSLNNIGDLRKHVLTHVKPRKCKICHKQFRDLYMLKIHLRVHTQANPYKCNLCEKAFRQYYSLKEHLDKHVGSKSVSCKYCSKVFSTKYNAKIHMRSIHESLEKCDLCGERFSTKAELIKHLHSSTEFCRGGDDVKKEVGGHPDDAETDDELELTRFNNVWIQTSVWTDVIRMYGQVVRGVVV